MNLPEGFDIDPEARRLTVLGVDLPVAHCWHSLAEPEQTHSFGMKLKRPHPAQEESAHINVLCGENGWWVEVDLWDGVATCLRPDEAAGEFVYMTAAEVLVKWRQVCERSDHPRDAGVDEDVDPFGGFEPGYWQWDNGERRDMSPEEEEYWRGWMRQQFPDMYEEEVR